MNVSNVALVVGSVFFVAAASIVVVGGVRAVAAAWRRLCLGELPFRNRGRAERRH